MKRKQDNHIYARNILFMMLVVCVVLCGHMISTATVYAMTKNEYDTKVNSFINDSRWRNGATWVADKTPEIAWNGQGCCA